MKRTVAYVLVVVGGAAGMYQMQHRTDETLRRNQLKACERGNVLRVVLNGNEKALERFITDAYNTRHTQAQAYRKAGDLTQARLNEKAAVSYAKARSLLKSVDQVDCQRVIR